MGGVARTRTEQFRRREEATKNLIIAMTEWRSRVKGG